MVESEKDTHLTLRPIIHQLLKIDGNGNRNWKKDLGETILVVATVVVFLEWKERLGGCGKQAHLRI